jgi:hypothetical protein
MDNNLKSQGNTQLIRLAFPFVLAAEIVDVIQPREIPSIELQLKHIELNPANH